MINKENIKNKISRTLVILVCTIIALIPSNAYALNNSYVDNVYAWTDINTYVYQTDDEFSYILKYIFDENEKCIYFFFSYSCVQAKDVPADKICFGVRISNIYNSYEIMINSDGLDKEVSSDLNRRIDINSRFTEINTKIGSGKILVGLELKDATDKKQLNNIDCFFCVNHGNRMSLIDNYTFDLQPPTTTRKPTTTRATTTKRQTTKRATTSRAQRTTKAKTTRNNTTARSTRLTSTSATAGKTSGATTLQSASKRETTIRETKFSPESKKYFTTTTAKTTKQKTTKSKSTSAKFKPSKFSHSANTTADFAQTTEVQDIEEISDYIPDEYETQIDDADVTQVTGLTQVVHKQVMSQKSKAVLVAAGIVLMSGILLISVALIRSRGVDGEKPDESNKNDTNEENDK